MYTIRQASDLLGIKVRGVRQRIHDGKIKAVKQDNGHWMIPKEEIRRIQDERKSC